jgi:hypothetical protein
VKRWPKVKEDTEKSRLFYEVHDRAKHTDMALLRNYKSRADQERYVVVLEKVFSLFGKSTAVSLSLLRLSFKVPF